MSVMRWRILECVLVLAIVFVFAQLFRPSTSTVYYFSPDSLESKYRPNDTLLGLISIAEEKPLPSALVEHLRDNGYWTPSGTPESQWIVTTQSTPSVERQDPSWLHKILYWKGYQDKWIAWTKDNPELARIVWPEFLASLRRHKSDREAIVLLYLARDATSIEGFRNAVQKSEHLGDEVKKSIATKEN